MIVVVDRSSVAMGDDAVSHRTETDVDPATTVGAFVARLLQPRPPLPSVAGEVAWLVQVKVSTDDEPWHERRTDVALITVPYPTGASSIVPLSRYTLGRTLGDVAQESTDGSVTIFFAYRTEGARMSYAGFEQAYGGV
ncbi:hypothetical protein Cch01nite_15390 [Cellulomonas chitinilytica]|uniref:Uncharacterized protein n=1 Tax=Cellulomonas chitinilytica TaxID=398759 RepID=A0A919P192_9CELL|nr:hypothetical protein [Cellulomonas chitinilytica]GIG20815.1 hypothetical protein Cch01nite_15390 [Cellulomonas chitinilytica]